MAHAFSSQQILIAHRACDRTMPENTLESLKRMEKKGARWFEIDCHLMKDGSVAVIHDEKLCRTTTGRGKITKLYPTDLIGVYVKGGDGGEKIPMLGDILDYCHQRDLHVMIEVKGKNLALVDKIDKLVSSYRNNLFVIYSFERKVVEAFLAKGRDYEVRWSMEKFSPRRLKKALELGVSLNLNGRYLSKSAIEKINGAGLDIHVYTVNDAGRARELFDQGVAAIITDTLFGGSVDG